MIPMFATASYIISLFPPDVSNIMSGLLLKAIAIIFLYWIEEYIIVNNKFIFYENG